MKKFRFRFEKLLHINQLRLRQRERDLARYIRAHREGVDILKSHQLRADAFMKELETTANDTAGSLKIKYGHYASIQSEISVQEKRNMDLRRDEEEARDQLLEARKQFKMMERLREIALENHTSEQRRTENRMQDEMITNRQNLKH